MFTLFSQLNGLFQVVDSFHLYDNTIKPVLNVNCVIWKVSPWTKFKKARTNVNVVWGIAIILSHFVCMRSCLSWKIQQTHALSTLSSLWSKWSLLEIPLLPADMAKCRDSLQQVAIVHRSKNILHVMLFITRTFFLFRSRNVLNQKLCH